ncbi:MAG TPA: hypothetical protein VLW17_00025 [Thermoanaerobaculaceae bacterium]|nr:hypothetical protein [Thermoanaerobaculaceae bacterium]
MTGRDLRPWLVAAGLWLVLALHAFCDPHPPDGVWGAAPVLGFSPALRGVALALAAALAFPPLAQRLVGSCRSALRRLAGGLAGVPAAAWIALLVAAGWILRGRALTGDGPDTIENLRRGELINYKEPLDRLLTALVYRAGHALIGWDAGIAIAFVSVAAGALYWAALLRLARRRPLGEGGAWAVWLLIATPGAVALFFGHVENYSLLTAGTAWTLVLAVEAAADPGRPLWPAALAFGLTFATHLSAAWLGTVLPVVWLVRVREANGGRWPDWSGWRPVIGEAIRGALVSVLPFAAVVAGMLAGGVGLGGFSAKEFGGGDGKLFVPLFKVETPFERFTMFSSAHFAGFGNELLLVAPAGLALALVGWLGRRSDGRRTDAGTWPLVAAAAGTALYAFVFNPDMMAAAPRLGVMNEWDLFAFEAVPITMLGLWWLRTAFEPGDVRDGVALSVGATALVHLIGWICLNAGIRL